MPAQRTATGVAARLGELLRYWRGVRGISQLGLASDAGTTPRYVSFVETGRAQPSRQMIVRLARALDVPLRDRNALLLAAGYAPLYSHGSLDGPELDRVNVALASMLDQHEPFPAIVMDRGWNVLRANTGARALFGRLLAPEPIPDPTNVLRLMLEPGRVRDSVVNWESVACALLDRAKREAVGGVLDTETAAVVSRLQARSELASALADTDAIARSAPVLDVRFRLDGQTLSFFSVVCTIGTPIDVTAQELRLEAFVPSDDRTRDAWPGNQSPPA